MACENISPRRLNSILPLFHATNKQNGGQISAANGEKEYLKAFSRLQFSIMAKPAEDERLTFLQSIVCGGIAGVLSRTLTSPLEVVKVLAQVGTPESRVGFFRSFNRIYRSEGLKAFWKGNGISCLRLIPYSAIQLAAFHNLLVSCVEP